MKLISIGIKFLQILMLCSRGSSQDVHTPTPLNDVWKDFVPGPINVNHDYESLPTIQFRDSAISVILSGIQAVRSSNEFSFLHRSCQETSTSDIPNCESHSDAPASELDIDSNSGDITLSPGEHISHSPHSLMREDWDKFKLEMNLQIQETFSRQIQDTLSPLIEETLFTQGTIYKQIQDTLSPLIEETLITQMCKIVTPVYSLTDE